MSDTQSNGLDTNFIRGFVRLTSGTEVPGIYAIWSAIGAVSCALGRRVWANFDFVTIFPNLYIVFVAGSGAKKSTPIMMADNMVRQLAPKPNLIPEKITPQKMISGMKILNTGDEKIVLAQNCTGYVFAEEFRVFLNHSTYDMGMGELLIKLYDCRDEFEYDTHIRGKETLRNSCFGILAGTTVQSLREALPSAAVGDGLTSRMIFVYCDVEAPPISLTQLTFSPEKKELKSLLVDQLTRISTLQGSASLTKDAIDFERQVYREWKSPDNPFKFEYGLGGYYHRRHNNIIKLAMVFSACDRSDLTIELRHMIAGHNLLKDTEETMKLVLNLITSSEKGTELEKVHVVIRQKGIVTKAELVEMFSHRLNFKELQEILDTLEQARRIISVVKTGQGGMREVVYGPVRKKAKDEGDKK